MTTTTDATPTAPSTPDSQGGLRIGDTSEFTLFFNVKPGMADKLRASIEKVRANTANREKFMSIGTVHDFRWVIFDDGTRLLFTSNFDGEWSLTPMRSRAARRGGRRSSWGNIRSVPAC